MEASGHGRVRSFGGFGRLLCVLSTILFSFSRGNVLIRPGEELLSVNNLLYMHRCKRDQDIEGDLERGKTQITYRLATN